MREKRFVENHSIKDLVVKPGKYFPKEGFTHPEPSPKEMLKIIRKYKKI